MIKSPFKWGDYVPVQDGYCIYVGENQWVRVGSKEELMGLLGKKKNHKEPLKEPKLVIVTETKKVKKTTALTKVEKKIVDTHGKAIVIEKQAETSVAEPIEQKESQEDNLIPELMDAELFDDQLIDRKGKLWRLFKKHNLWLCLGAATEQERETIPAKGKGLSYTPVQPESQAIAWEVDDINRHGEYFDAGEVLYIHTSSMSKSKTNTYTGYVKCHANPTHIFTIETEKGPVAVFAGAGKDVDWTSVKSVIDLDGFSASAYDARPSRGFERASKLLAGGTSEKYIHIKTADRSYPNVKREFWEALIEDLKADAPQYALICCMGGHGRTGMAATIVAILAGVVPQDEDPVEWLRNRYCDKAVESQSQIDYITQITGVPIKAKKSDGW
jgi:hypothetical protein